MIESNDEMKEEISSKSAKIKSLESELNEKDTKLRIEQKSCTNQILEREKEFISMLDLLRNKAKNEDNKIISQTNMESLQIKDTVMYSTVPSRSTIIVKNDMKNIICEIDEIKKKIKH